MSLAVSAEGARAAVVVWVGEAGSMCVVLSADKKNIEVFVTARIDTNSHVTSVAE